MSSVTFTQEQIEYIKDYTTKGIDSIIDYLNDADEDGVSPEIL